MSKSGNNNLDASSTEAKVTTDQAQDAASRGDDALNTAVSDPISAASRNVAGDSDDENDPETHRLRNELLEAISPEFAKFSAAVKKEEAEMGDKDEKAVQDMIDRLAKEHLGTNASAELEKREQLLKKLSQMGSTQEDKDRDHRFWSTQPVVKHSETIVEENGPIDEIKTVDQIQKEPLTLMKGFIWSTIDMNNEQDLEDMYNLLLMNYVEDSDGMFRFAYPKEFLRWCVIHSYPCNLCPFLSALIAFSMLLSCISLPILFCILCLDISLIHIYVYRALTPPGYYPDWHVGVRLEKSNRLVACITGIPAHIQIYDNKEPLHVCEINFLCVTRKLRSKRLAPVLIREVTRRVNLKNIWQAIFTAGIVLPKPITTARYWHRSINPKKLIEVQFSRLSPDMTMQRTQRHYKLPEVCFRLNTLFVTLNWNLCDCPTFLTNILCHQELTPYNCMQKPSIPGIRPFQPSDAPSARALLNAALTRRSIHSVFMNDEEFTHQFMSREGVVNCYVVTRWVKPEEAAEVQANLLERVKQGNLTDTSCDVGVVEKDEAHTVEIVTDITSFYHLPSYVLKHPEHKDLLACYLYYYANGSQRLFQLLQDTLILARDNNADVFNCLDIMDHAGLLRDLKFGPGDGYLRYYLYNWACPQMPPSDMGVVLT